jgi:mannitol/fructose-specific phosphotransferase system IIA component (Ntr-type)
MLTDYITPDLIRLQVAVKGWREAVRQGGELLQLAGICEARYVDAMIRAVEQLGPYMVLAPGLALAHARPEDGVLKVGMSIITLSTPVDFGSKENDPVKLVISFGGIDKTSHIGMLQELARFLMVPENQEFLRNATSVDGILKALKQ